jgi:hypothetical protein
MSGLACQPVLDRAWRCGGSQVRTTAICPIPEGLLSPDLSTRDLFSVLDERVAAHADGRLGQPARGARGRAVNAQLLWASGSRGIPPAAGPFLVTHSTPPGLRRGEQLGEDGQRLDGAAAYSRPPGSAEPKHSSAFERHVQLDDSPVVRGATVSGAGSQAEMRPDGSTGARNRGRSRCAPAQRSDRRLVLAPIVEQVLRDRR